MTNNAPSDPIFDPVLGELHWDTQVEWWRSELEFRPGQMVRVSVFGHDLQPILEQRRAQFTRIRSREPELRAAIAEEMLEMAEDWRDEDEEPEPITLESFVTRVQLEAIVLYENDSAQLYYDDDEIFAAHTIVANLGADGELKAANIAG